MTKETAIEALSHCMVEHRCEDGIWGHCDGCNQRIALDMAIKSLKRETEEFEWCHDCKEYDQEAHCCHRWTKAIRKTVEEIKNQWIPCGERLPEPYDDVVISAKGYVCEANLRESKEYFLTHNARLFIKTEEVDAWMPLPKPYEGRAE